MCADRTTRKHRCDLASREPCLLPEGFEDEFSRPVACGCRAGSTPPLSLATCESYLSKCRQLWQDHASTLAQSPQHGEL